jgi:hypothetical protein
MVVFVLLLQVNRLAIIKLTNSNFFILYICLLKQLTRFLKIQVTDIFKVSFQFLLAYFVYLMLVIIVPQLSLQPEVGFLQLKTAVYSNTVWRVSFYTHVFSSIFVLCAGFTQFSKWLLVQKPRTHRLLGYAYVSNVLLVTGPSALIMSFYANGGPGSVIAFVLLAVLWIGITLLALIKAWQGNIQQHKNFMIRSYALTLSAISLRLWKVFFAAFTDVAPMDRYRIIAWLGWVLNLAIAEYIIFAKNKQYGKA